MITINDTQYSEQDFAAYDTRFANMDFLFTANHIAVCLEDNMEWLALCFYAKKHQLSVMPIHPSTPLNTAKKLAVKSSCDVLFYHQLDNVNHLELDAESMSSNRINEEPAGLIQMSSGTTGDPKSIKRSWADIDVEIASYLAVFTQAENMTPVIACPVTHSYGLICGVLVALARGQAPVIVTNINPKYLIKTLSGCTEPLLYSSPTMLEMLISLWPNTNKLHAAMTSGTIMSKPVFDKLNAKVTHLFQQYGCSEAGCISICQKMNNANDIGTPLPHMTVTCSKVKDGPSEIIVNIKSEDGAAPKTIHTQDLGYLETNDSGELTLRFIARLDDTIIVAGQNVYPQEIEDIILTHPTITDAVIFKVDDRFAGHRVCLQYQAVGLIDAADVRQWCREQLASYQIPQHLQQVEQIERLANGKVNRKKIALTFLNATEKKPAPQTELA